MCFSGSPSLHSITPEITEVSATAIKLKCPKAQIPEGADMFYQYEVEYQALKPRGSNRYFNTRPKHANLTDPFVITVTGLKANTGYSFLIDALNSGLYFLFGPYYYCTTTIATTRAPLTVANKFCCLACTGLTAC